MLNTKLTHGIRLYAIVAAGGDKPTTLQSAADEVGISMSYAEQIIVKLVRAKLVRGRRGPHGGYLLIRKVAVATLVGVLLDRKLLPYEKMLLNGSPHLVEAMRG